MVAHEVMMNDRTNDECDTHDIGEDDETQNFINMMDEINRDCCVGAPGQQYQVRPEVVKPKAPDGVGQRPVSQFWIQVMIPQVCRKPNADIKKVGLFILDKTKEEVMEMDLDDLKDCQCFAHAGQHMVISIVEGKKISKAVQKVHI